MCVHTGMRADFVTSQTVVCQAPLFEEFLISKFIFMNLS